MAWYNETGVENDVVISSRVRLARNISGYPFGSKLTDDKRGEIIEKVTKALAPASLETIDLVAKTKTESAALAEKRFISESFAEQKAPHTLLLSQDRNSAVMICAEDHVKIQGFAAGLDLKKAFERAVALDDLLDEGVEIAYSESRGYLTENLTDLGTGMRASVLIHLPAITMAHQIVTVIRNLSKLGVSIRPFIGDGSDSTGSVYQISSTITMGLTEEEILDKLCEVAKQLIDSERKLRGTLKSDSFAPLCDRVMRAGGILSSAYMLGEEEFLKLWSDVRLGVSLGILDKPTLTKLDELLILASPANVLTNSGAKTDVTAGELETLRAKAVKAVYSVSATV